MNKKEIKKMDIETLKGLYDELKQDAVKAIEAGTIVPAIRYLEAAVKIEWVLTERGIAEET